ncbi:MAG: cytochrome c peroxidase, partial [Saprospiraceae bacterium]
MRSFKIGLLAFLLLFGSCQDDPKLDLNDLSQIAYNPVEYPLIIPKGLPILPDFINSPLTKDQVQLGRHLFYDPILSSDSTMSCA